MGNGGATLLPAPDDRLVKSIKILELSNTDLSKVRTTVHYCCDYLCEKPHL